MKAAGLIAGKPAPTSTALLLRFVQSNLWELACRRCGRNSQKTTLGRSSYQANLARAACSFL